MKKILSLILIAVMLLTLASCNRTDEISVGDGMKLAGRSAGNEAVEYSFQYPEEWTLIRNDGVVEIQFDCNKSDQVAVYANLCVLSFTLKDTNETAKQNWESYQEEVKSVYTDFKLLDVEEYNDKDNYLDDAPALKVKYVGKVGSVEYLCEQIICCRYGSVYYITLTVPNEYASEVDGVMKSVKDSFEFQDKGILG
ncbi:MAG: hypothetical protein IKT34_01510 [Clostridia bacterium]|nr:hypothetical protein [Clostridia bacterium]